MSVRTRIQSGVLGLVALCLALLILSYEGSERAIEIDDENGDR